MKREREEAREELGRQGLSDTAEAGREERGRLNCKESSVTYFKNVT